MSVLLGTNASVTTVFDTFGLFPSFDEIASMPVGRTLVNVVRGLVSGVWTELRVMHSRLSTSMTPVPVISTSRLYSLARPDQKHPILGVFLPDFGMEPVAFFLPVRYFPTRCLLNDNRSNDSFSKWMRCACSENFPYRPV